MQQDTFYYHNFPQDPRLQFQNQGSFPVENNPTQWPATYMTGVNLDQSTPVPPPYQFGHQIPPNNVTPVSTAVYGMTPTFSWAHTVPSLMPWVAQGDQNVPDPIMRFTAPFAPFPPDPCTSQTATSWELLNNLGANKTNVNMHLKRKSDLDVLEASAPHKLCITEERMAARLKELHISNQYSIPVENSSFGPFNNASNSAMVEKSVTNLQQLEAMIKGSGAEGSSKLVLAPELKKLVEPEKIFATTFLGKVERPSMAVVLWQPQTKLLTNENAGSAKAEDDKKESLEGDITLKKQQNNNFLPEQSSAIQNPNSSFTMSQSSEISNTLSPEDIMDT